MTVPDLIVLLNCIAILLLGIAAGRFAHMLRQHAKRIEAIEQSQRDIGAASRLQRNVCILP